MTAPAARIRAFDWLRGLAVLFMIQCHALSLLRPELRQGLLAQRLIWLDGLVAPSFIFAAGFSLALVQVRGAKAGNRRQRVLKTARRLGEVLFVACAVNWMWFPVFREPRWFLRVDILQCIGLALVIALPLMASLAGRPQILRWVSLALGVAVFLLSPAAQGVRGGWALLANQSTDGWLPGAGATFPLFPWAGYVYLGASAGATAAMGDLRRLVHWVLGLGAVGLAFWMLSHQYLVSNHGNRVVVLALLVLGLLALEYLAAPRSAGWLKSPPVRFVEVFGASSLAGYFFHQMLLYYEGFGAYQRWIGFSFHRYWGDRCSWPAYWLLTAALIAATFLLVLGMDRVYRRYDAWVRRAMGDRPPATAPTA